AVTMFDIVKKLPDGAQVQLEKTSMGRLRLSAGTSEFSLQVLPEDDFPSLPQAEDGQRFTVPTADLARLIDKARFAMSQEETRYYLNGIYLHVAAEKLTAVATDGHRLARMQLDMPEGADGIPGVIVPRKAVSEALKLVDDLGGPVQVALSDVKVQMDFGAVVLTSKLIDGTFPDYERVIPRGNDKAMQIDKAAFAAAVDRVSTVSSERGRAIKLSVDDGQLTLTVNNPDSGTATEEIAVGYEAEPIEIGFNSRYLLDIAGQLEGESATFRMQDAGSPTLVQDGVQDDVETADRALYVLMPMRV
ncbi:MAG: DNA polymerase III subunit beta, partial [Pseudomonadota bacterium]